MSAAQRLEDHMKPAQQETRIALLEQSIGHINQSLMRIENRFDLVDKRFDKIDARLDKLESRDWANFYWILGTMFTLACAGFGALAQGFHWFG